MPNPPSGGFGAPYYSGARMARLLDQLATGIVVVCAVIMAATSVSRRSESRTSRKDPVAGPIVVDPLRVEATRPFVLKEGPDRPFVLVEFVDVECPYCADFSEVLDSARSILGDSLQVQFVNFPIFSHRFARSGASAIECAFTRGVGNTFIRQVYRNQDSIGFWPWTKYASLVGIRDSSDFSACLRSERTLARVDSSLSAAKSLGVNSTPTLLLGIELHRGALSLEQLLRLVRRPTSEGDR